MGGTKAQYEIVSDFQDRCAAVLETSPELRGSFDPALLRMVKITNKSGSPDGPFFKVIRVAQPLGLFCPFRYVVVAWQDTWDALTEDAKVSLISDVVKHVAIEEIGMEDTVRSTIGC